MLTRRTASFTVTRRVLKTMKKEKKKEGLPTLPTTTPAMTTQTKTVALSKAVAMPSAKIFDAATPPTAATSTAAAPKAQRPQLLTVLRSMLTMTMMVAMLLLAVLVLLAMLMLLAVVRLIVKQGRLSAYTFCSKLTAYTPPPLSFPTRARLLAARGSRRSCARALVRLIKKEESHSESCFFLPRVWTRKPTLSRPGRRYRREECRFALVTSSHPETHVGSAWSSSSCRIR